MSSFGLGRTNGVAAASAADEPMDASTPWMAAADGNLPLLQAALQSLQLPVSAQDENGYTFLMAAVSYHQVHVWQWLMTQPHFDVQAVDEEGDSALHYAGTLEAARFLVEHGIDTGLRNKEGMTALEKKREELEELRQDEDFDETSFCDEYKQLLEMIGYLSSLTTIQQ